MDQRGLVEWIGQRLKKLPKREKDGEGDNSIEKTNNSR